MLKPSDVSLDTVVLDPDNLKSIEEQFDRAIVTAAKTYSWPAVVGHCRDTASYEEIQHVAGKYCAAGWTVTTNLPSCRARIDHPDRKV